MSDTRDREIAELEARILALRAQPAAPEPAAVPAEVIKNPEPEPVQASGLNLSAEGKVRSPEPEPSTMYGVQPAPGRGP